MSAVKSFTRRTNHEHEAQTVPLLVSSAVRTHGVARIFGNPRLAAIRTVDLVQLIAIGMCFGVALTTLVTFLRRPRDRQV